MRLSHLKKRPGGGPGRALILALGIGAALQGCGDLTSAGRPERARFTLDGPAAATMSLTTSEDFFVRQDGGLEFNSSQTSTVTLPYDDTVSLGAPARFYISAANAGDQAQTFSMKVWIGGKIWYNETKILAPGDDFEFVYRYNEPGIY